MYLWEVSIDTTPAQKMTGLGSSPVLQGEARLSAWRRCYSNATPSLKALGHCHHSCSDLCQRCSAVFRGPLRAVYRIKLEKKVLATKDRELVAGIVLSTGCGPRATVLERPAEPKACLRAEINKIKCSLHCFI